MAAKPVHQFSVDGIQFALGLFWQPLSGVGKQEPQIRELAEELAFDLYVVRTGSTATFSVGFANSSQALKPGKVHSAAAVVSKTLEVERNARDFLFVAPLPDGRWAYIAQRDGTLLPDGDQVFASEDAARACLLEHTSLGEWQVVVAPAIWGIAGSVDASFRDMLPKKSSGKIKVYKWWRLLPVGKKAKFSLHVRKIAAAAIIAAAATGGWFYWEKLQADKAAEEAALLALQQANAPKPPPEHPWKSQPLARDMQAACLSVLATQQLFPGNWDIREVVCADGRLVVAWKPRPGGWIEHLKAVVPGAVVAMDGSSASVGAPLAPLSTGMDEPAPTENDRLIAMYSTAQRYGVKFVVAPAASPQAVLPGQGETAPPDWKEIAWRAEGVTLPEVVLSALDGDGFRMKSMRAEWRDGAFVWTMEGTQYVR